ncbi:hypothetical protein GO730_00590 [Spirosoma sp. HMF3257]|uniref:Phage major capsid protein n=1 Tax=Spirosoma telluris TaxID=2183553 RepID=A0A327NDP9_9BACT|nr:hypothetical protein [Spirosoma telluris]RAI73297.1 hypothetical protein HMF3257_00575 [Spirosoma telluris]
MASLNMAALAAALKQNVADYSMIYQEKLANGFSIKQDPLFTVIPTVDQFPLVRDSTGAIMQPGRKGTVNFTNNFLTLNNRMGILRPFKVDLQLDEVTLYAWTKMYGSIRKGTDPKDIYSFAAMDYYMSRVMARMGRDTLNIVWDGVYNAAGTGVVDIADGFKLLFAQGYATSGTGWVGDIPAANMTTAAASITQANVLSEINNLVLAIVANVDVPTEEDAQLCLDPTTFVYLQNAMSSALSNGQAIVTQTNGEYRLAALPNTKVVAKKWLKTAGKMFWTLNGNLVVITPEVPETVDAPSLSIEHVSRTINIFLDGEFGLNYIDGRYIYMNSK